ncbi:cytochrome P450 [Streptomyces pathocidini]|uniref:cytochrome P450 n=1 Tax=Streptomyces pathocidini TaxID=1650571 RepID=UPI0033DB3751
MEPHHSEAASGCPYAPLESMDLEPLLNRDYEARPSLVYERLRAEHGPVAPVDLLGVPVWLVLGYKEAFEVLQNTQAWPKGLENWKARTEGRVPGDWPLAPSLEVNHVLIQDGEGHRALRAAWDAALKPFQDPSHVQAKRLRAVVTECADELISVLADGDGSGLADMSAQFARPLPLMVASHLLGFPNSQGDDALMDMWRVLDAGQDAGPALERLLGALAELGTQKMAEPGDDFPSYLLAAHPELTVDELARELMMLLGMVSDHVGILISNTIVEVIGGDGEARASLSSGILRETMNRVVMNKPPLVNFPPRFPVSDRKLGNYTIAAGDQVWVSIAAAHADPIFAGNVAQSAAVSTRAHLAWGAGPRQCPARELATTVAAVAVSRVFERFSELELDLPADQLPWRSSPFMRGLRSMPVHYQLAEAPAGTESYADQASTSAAETAAEAVTSVEGAGRSRSSLWRYLAGLVRGR